MGAEHRDRAIIRGDRTALGHYDQPAPAGPLRHYDCGISVSGQARNVSVIAYKHYEAYSFDASGAIVTVVARHAAGQALRFEEVKDLEPFIQGWLAELRQHYSD